MLKLISATPSPYARKVRIALAEKGIPFELMTEIPWESTTQTPLYNPLQKLPVLIFPDGKAIYESHYILEYLETKYPGSPLLPKGADKIDDALFAKQVEVVADGICDALVLSFFEAQRGEEKRSEEWMARQRRKVDGGLRALAEWFGDDDQKEYLVNGSFGLADIAAGSCLGYIKVRSPEHPWRKLYPHLNRYSERLEERMSFQDTVPKPQSFSEKIA
ncbi:glutathione S-transferase, partial [Lecanoromycetidae sp. Uapishka_2]